MFNAKILCDSVNPEGCRLTTFELTYPRMIHSELLTHREFSRNSASSRAIPVSKLIKTIEDHPVIPQYWGKNQKGMQAYEELSDLEKSQAIEIWKSARDTALDHTKKLMEMGVHKQIANRLLEPYMWITVIVSSTNYDHFLSLRDHHAAEPHFQKLARLIRLELESNIPTRLSEGEWHLPLVSSEERENYSLSECVKISVARCARVSYTTHDKSRDVLEEFTLHDQLRDNKHWSPFEHAARSEANSSRIGNFNGFTQIRKLHQDEYVPRTIFR